MITKLLAVDDSKTMRRVLEITFGGDDFQATICGGGADALAALRQDRPTVALVDSALSGESGYDLCRAIKQEAPDVRVLILSSKQRPYDEGQGRAAGADGNFDKPFDSAKLIEKVAGLVAGAPVAAAPSAAAVAPPVAAPAAIPAAARPASAGPRPQLGTPAAPPVSAGPRPVVPSAAPRVPAPAASPLAHSAPAQPSARPQVPVAAPVAAAPVAAASAIPVTAAVTSAAFSDKLKELGLSQSQLEGVLSLSREVVEQVVWEVVPTLAETLIKEEIARLTAG
ncbi:MAG TPA: response regulator [Polyangiaceae bacterium]|nr:response regulator [Polyangiaceae bacterium]